MKRTLFSLAVVVGFTSASAEDWPNFQGPNLNGVSSETGLKLTDWGDGPEVLWKRTFNEGFGGSAIVGGEVFLIDRVPGETDVLYCLDLKDGSEKWKYSFDHAGKLAHPGSRGVPLVTDDAVFFIGGFGHVHRINRETHKPDWTVAIQEKYGAEPPKWGWAQSPVLSGNTIIVPAMSEDVGLVGFNKDTGDEMWRTEGFGNSHSNPTLLTLHGVEQAVFVATNGKDSGTTISVAPDTGKVLWKTDAYFNKIPIPFPTKVTEDLVYLTGGYDNGSCMISVNDKWEVTKKWEITQGTQMHPPFVIGDHIYFLANENSNHKGEKRANGGLACMDFKGNIVWNTGNDPFMGRGNMIYADGKLLIQDGEVGYLRVVEPSPEGYKEVAFADVFDTKEEVDSQIAKQEGRSQIKIPDFKYWSPMALSDGHLVMRGQEHVVCLKLK
ncbi:MAG: PQQ-binding-like beta-propeller repeat protein [Verrucomicrobiales bacterium]|nr:PQQ-binding-like beta-propeller repeat protein [Verrucomicrobiales bacterium]